MTANARGVYVVSPAPAAIAIGASIPISSAIPLPAHGGVMTWEILEVTEAGDRRCIVLRRLVEGRAHAFELFWVSVGARAGRHHVEVSCREGASFAGRDWAARYATMVILARLNDEDEQSWAYVRARWGDVRDRLGSD